jgi:hypothetical protein
MNDRLAYLHSMVLHRCPELSDRDLALMTVEADDALPRQIAEQILTVLEVLEQRMDALAGSWIAGSARSDPASNPNLTFF